MAQGLPLERAEQSQGVSAANGDRIKANYAPAQRHPGDDADVGVIPLVAAAAVGEAVERDDKPIAAMGRFRGVGAILSERTVLWERAMRANGKVQAQKKVDISATIAGQVTDSYGLLGKGAYQVDDGTGSMWVATGSHGAPSKGAKAGNWTLRDQRSTARW